MYPECTHSITLRVWGTQDGVADLAQRLPFQIESHGKREKGRNFAVLRFSREKTANLEDELNRFLDLIDKDDVNISTQISEAWIVVSLDEFSLFNLRDCLMERLAAAKLSLSFENHT